MNAQRIIKKITVVIMIVSILIFGVGCGFMDETQPQNKAESNAVKFLEYKYEGKTQKFVDSILDEVVKEMIVAGGYETENILVYALDKEMQNSIDGYKDEYGKKWKYDISIIDSYAIPAPEDFSECECMEVVLNVQHEGRKFLFFKVDGTEEVKIQMIQKEDSWYVWSVSFVLI